MIKISIATLDKTVPVLEKINEQDLSAAISFKFATIINEVNAKLVVFNTEKNKLFKKYGEEMKDSPGQIKVKDENIEIFSSEYSELLQQEVELNLKKLSIDDFKDVKINPTDAMSILWLMED